MIKSNININAARCTMVFTCHNNFDSSNQCGGGGGGGGGIPT
jgi:hypothetical protein